MKLLQVCALSAAFAATPVAAATFAFQGKAIGDNGQVLYTEHHQVAGACTDGYFRPADHQADYRHPDGGTGFAQKHLVFAASPLRPAVTFSQPAFDEKLTIRYPEPDRATIEWLMPSGNQKSFSVKFDQKLVVDSGFDHLIRAKWRELRDGESVDFRFLGPTRGEHYGFVAEPVSNSDINADLVVRLRPTSMILRLLVDPIVLGYNNRGALTDYLGLTNIRQNADNNYTAHLRYKVTGYPDCPLLP